MISTCTAGKDKVEAFSDATRHILPSRARHDESRGIRTAHNETSRDVDCRSKMEHITAVQSFYALLRVSEAQGLPTHDVDSPPPP